MAERMVMAELVGLRYDCNECGEEMTANGETLSDGQRVHKCANGHTVALPKVYPGYDILLTNVTREVKYG